jgi:hypothetical protein
VTNWVTATMTGGRQWTLGAAQSRRQRWSRGLETEEITRHRSWAGDELVSGGTRWCGAGSGSYRRGDADA